MARLKARYGAPLFCFGPHVSTHAGRVDGARAGRRRHVRRRARGRAPRARRAASRSTGCRRDAEPDVPPRRPDRRRIARTARSPGFLTAPYPAWDLLDLSQVPPAARQPVLRHRRDLARLPVLVRLLRRADPSGPQVPREERQGARRRDRARLPRVRPDVLLSLGRHGHAERQDVQRVLRRADRAQAADAVVRQRARGQPDGSGVRQAAAPGRLLDAGARASRPSRKRRART